MLITCPSFEFQKKNLLKKLKIKKNVTFSFSVIYIFIGYLALLVLFCSHFFPHRLVFKYFLAAISLFFETDLANAFIDILVFYFICTLYG